jgi:hypothetical protein
MKAMLLFSRLSKEPLSSLRKSSRAQRQHKAKNNLPLEVTLLLNTYNGTKELLIPISYEDSFEYKKDIIGKWRLLKAQKVDLNQR